MGRNTTVGDETLQVFGGRSMDIQLDGDFSILIHLSLARMWAQLTDSGTPLTSALSMQKAHPSRSPSHPLPTPLPNPSSSELPTRSTSGIFAGPAITFLDGPGTETSGACEKDGEAGADGEDDIIAWNAGPAVSSSFLLDVLEAHCCT